MNEIVDAHTHVFTPDVIKGRERYVGRDLWFEHLYANPAALLIDAPSLLASMDAAGIARAMICGFPWHDLAICREHNDYLADVAAASDGRLAWLGTVSPGVAGADREVERCFERGASGIGELNADAQRFDLTETAVFARIARVCIEADRPVMVHASEPLGHLYPGKGTATPDRLLRFIEANPRLRIVLAHWGGGLPFYELMPEVAAATVNVTYDSAASSYLYTPNIFETVVGLVGSERVMWGSDYPVLRQDRFLERTRARDLPKRDLAAILGQTARRVYRLAALEGAR